MLLSVAVLCVCFDFKNRFGVAHARLFAVDLQTDAHTHTANATYITETGFWFWAQTENTHRSRTQWPGIALSFSLANSKEKRRCLI